MIAVFLIFFAIGYINASPTPSSIPAHVNLTICGTETSSQQRSKKFSDRLNGNDTSVFSAEIYRLAKTLRIISSSESCYGSPFSALYLYLSITFSALENHWVTMDPSVQDDPKFENVDKYAFTFELLDLLHSKFTQLISEWTSIKDYIHLRICSWIGFSESLIINRQQSHKTKKISNGRRKNDILNIRSKSGIFFYRSSITATVLVAGISSCIAACLSFILASLITSRNRGVTPSTTNNSYPGSYPSVAPAC